MVRPPTLAGTFLPGRPPPGVSPAPELAHPPHPPLWSPVYILNYFYIYNNINILQFLILYPPPPPPCPRSTSSSPRTAPCAVSLAAPPLAHPPSAPLLAEVVDAWSGGPPLGTPSIPTHPLARQWTCELFFPPPPPPPPPPCPPPRGGGPARPPTPLGCACRLVPWSLPPPPPPPASAPPPGARGRT